MYKNAVCTRRIGPLRGTTEKKNHRLNPARAKWTPDDLVAIFGRRWWRPSWQPGSKFHQQDYLIDLWCCAGPDDCDHLHFWTPIICHRCSTDRSASACCHRPGYPSTVFSMDKSWRWTGSRIGPFDKRFRTN